MQSRKLTMAIVSMTALVVVWWLYLRSGRYVAPGAELKREDNGSQSVTTPERRPVQPRTRGTTPSPAGPAVEEPQPLTVSQGEQSPLKLSSEQIEKFLQRNQRSADSLRIAFLVAHDTNYLDEAAARFPNHPNVQLCVLLQNDYPEERGKWLDAFKESSPANSLANYLAARENFNSGKLDEAIKELAEATRKPVFQDYTADSLLALEELSREAGLSSLESRTTALAAWASEHMTELAQLKNLTHGIVDLQKQFQTAGDAQSFKDLSQMALALGGRLNSGDESKFMINQLVGIAIEALSLGQLPQDTPFDFLDGKTPKERADQLLQQSQELKSLARDFQSVLVGVTESERITFYEKMRLFGEAEATRWLLQRR